MHDDEYMASGPSPAAAPPVPVRLLIVDDDASIRMLLEVSISLDPRFELAGSASSGAECIALLDDHAATGVVDVVLLDVTLPDRDGIDLVRDVRSCGCTARVALFTGWSDDKTIQRAREAGADAVFPKDGEQQKLLDGLAALLP